MKNKMPKNAAVKRVLQRFSLLLLLPSFFAFGIWAQPPKDQPAENKPSPQDAAKVNPVKPTPESLAKGKKLYGIDCAMCHGKDGDGKGDMASDMKNVTDFTKPGALKNRTDGELYFVLRHGKGEMPPEGDRAKDEDIWNLVNYIRSLAKQ